MRPRNTMGVSGVRGFSGDPMEISGIFSFFAAGNRIFVCKKVHLRKLRKISLGVLVRSSFLGKDFEFASKIYLMTVFALRWPTGPLQGSWPHSPGYLPKYTDLKISILNTKEKAHIYQDNVLRTKCARVSEYVHFQLQFVCRNTSLIMEVIC